MNLLKTNVFILFRAPTGSRFKQHFHPWIIENMDLEAVCHVGTSNQEQVTKKTQSGSQEAPKMDAKLDQNRPGPQGVYWVSLWTPGSPKWSLSVPK